ncbi:hypothetical protein [Actinoallomurus acaciae]|uniref:Uncharacterized protein n=1 Tax=Actinoallomurus acaciae TaxID=502577 RepID=A0ABV5YSK5_9ACTN
MHPDQPNMAIGNLSSAFPEIAVENKLKSADLTFWGTHLRRGATTVSLEEFVTALLGDFLPGTARRGLKVTLFPEANGIRIQVNGSAALSDQDDRPFSLNQTYTVESGVLTIHVETVVAPKKGQAFVRSCLLAHARLFTVGRLTLSASSIGGSQEGVFVWARYGFVPTVEDWDIMRRWGLRELDGTSGALSGVRDTVRPILLDPVPIALRRLVHFSWTAADQKAAKSFLDRLLTANLSWKGALDLTDAASANWIAAYAESGRPGDGLDRFQALLPAPSGRSVAPPEPQAEPEPESQGYGGTGLSEQDLVNLLAAKITDKEAGMEDVRKEYPELVAKVQAVLDRSRT